MSHIFFTDDCILISRATIQDAIYLEAIMDSNCMILGQTVNFSKPHIIFNLSTPSRIKNKICNFFRVGQKENAWNYLNVPIAGTSLAPSDFNFLIGKFTSKSVR